MKPNYIALLLAVLVIMSAGLRLLQVGTIPAGLNRDEAALAYNGYLLSETGQDEWGKTWPLTLLSFGDVKLVGYPAILSVLFTFFSETDQITRLPSALAGSLLPVLLYLLARQSGISKRSAVVIALLSVVTPVFFFFSRMAFEANVALSFFLAGLVLLLSQNRSFALIKDGMGLLMMIVAMLIYNTPLLLFPFVVMLVPVLRGIKNLKNWLPVVSVGVIIWMVMYWLLTSAISQKSGITVFSDETVLNHYPVYRAQFQGASATLLGNKIVYYLFEIFTNAWQSFQYEFLVQKGGSHPWHTLPNWGHLYSSTYVIALVGLATLGWRAASQLWLARTKISWLSFSNPLRTEKRYVVALWLLMVGLLPSIITVDSPHATRSLFFFVMLLIMVGYGLDAIPGWTKLFFETASQRMFNLAVTIFLITSVWQTWDYLSTYFSQYPQSSAMLFKAGISEQLQKVKQSLPNQPVAVVDPAGYDYILVSWYDLISPEEFFSSIVKQQPDRIGFRYGEKVGQYHFIAQSSDRSPDEKALLIWDGTNWVIKE